MNNLYLQISTQGSFSGLGQLYHSANHYIPIHTVRRFDNVKANMILDRHRDNGYVYVPPNISAGAFIQFSCDNIDVLEDTIDGKNTFHCTQMMTGCRVKRSLKYTE